MTTSKTWPEFPVLDMNDPDFIAKFRAAIGLAEGESVQFSTPLELGAKLKSMQRMREALAFYEVSVRQHFAAALNDDGGEKARAALASDEEEK